MTLVRETPQPQDTVSTACPFRRSVNLKTTSKIIDESTCWRCIGCGVIWNPGRQGRQRGHSGLVPCCFDRRSKTVA